MRLKLLYVCCLWNCCVMAQSDSLRITLQLHLSNTVTGNAIAGQQLNVVNLLQEKVVQQLVSDSSGNASTTFQIEEGGSFFVRPVKGKYTCEKTVACYVLNADTSITASIELLPQKICWDSFLESYIYFERNTTKVVDSSGYYTWLSGSSMLLQETDKTLQITGYCRYDESKRMAKRRAEQVKTELIVNGWSEDRITVVVAGKSDLFICQYCDGCHYEHLKGTGITIDRKMLNNAGSEQDTLESMHSCVRLEWIVP